MNLKNQKYFLFNVKIGYCPHTLTTIACINKAVLLVSKLFITYTSQITHSGHAITVITLFVVRYSVYVNEQNINNLLKFVAFHQVSFQSQITNVCFINCDTLQCPLRI